MREYGKLSAKGGWRIRGFVSVQVLDEEGKPRRQPAARPVGLFGALARLWRNGAGKAAVTSEADILSGILAYRQDCAVTGNCAAVITDAILSATGYIQVGTGWTRKRVGYHTRCNAAKCTRPLDTGYPSWSWMWGSKEDTTISYRTTFPPGALDARGINEVCLLSGEADDIECIAYGKLSPRLRIRRGDTLQIDWDIIVHG
jgi:hypothetical protein